MYKYQPVIGLEIHVELKTKSKMFCQDSADYFGKKPNTHVCPVCLGLPGALPVPNKKAIEWTILIGQALNCSINKVSKFDRKHYFYPDLPKGYQISQYDEPIASNGWLKFQISNFKFQIKEKKFRIHRVHLEEDTGKLIHSGSDTLVDFNRSGVPLVEIVTEPDFDNSDDVKRFLEELHTIIRYLGVSDADMEKGSMRLEPNISLRKISIQDSGFKIQELPNYKVEVKNINSFNFVKRAIEYEIKRQTEILEKGETPAQETRGFDSVKGITYSQRSKEEAHDYRYFPEPDIPPLEFTYKEIEDIKKKLPELPSDKEKRLIKEYRLKAQDAFILTRDLRIADYFEKVTDEFNKLMLVQDKASVDIEKQQSLGQTIANLIVNKRLSTSLDPEEFAKKAITSTVTYIADREKMDKAVSKVIDDFPKAVEDYKAGKTNSIMFLVGQVMKEMKGQVDANTVKKKLIKILK
ncbi:MAG: Asp-tRNA(Asn)/Glu-tRNA(Gln) amidotransferase subunit GatB [Candidatus Roizmanbacteria bacterium]|nr:MAG: Asp-tRNA(Asn)/Glu-tRNA(Gln) amidotransferase subunit GatB [Candidatus Roizmanbacteria bacterium]